MQITRWFHHAQTRSSRHVLFFFQMRLSSQRVKGFSSVQYILISLWQFSNRDGIVICSLLCLYYIATVKIWKWKKKMCGKSINIHSTYISQIMYTQKLINWWWILCLRNLKLAHYTHATFARLWIVASICFVLFCFFLVFEKLIFILENVENDMVKPSVSSKAQLYKVANTIWHLVGARLGRNCIQNEIH